MKKGNVLLGSPTKTMYQETRNQKSMKLLASHLRQYSLPTKPKKKSDHELQLQQLMSNNVQVFDKKYEDKVYSLVDNVLLNLSIFKKVFANNKKKRIIIEKLYGWDEAFGNAFFNENQIKYNIRRDDVVKELHLDKKSFASKNLYNKMRFFLAQLIDINNKQQQLESRAKKGKLFQASTKLLQNLDRYSEESKKKQNKKYTDMMRSTHIDLVNMKMRIKNKGNDLQKIVQKTGRVKMDPFFLNEERNVHYIETFAKEALMKK